MLTSLNENFSTFNSAVWVKSDNRANAGTFNVGWKADHALIIEESGIYTFHVRRSGDTAVACSVGWALQGTGANPITGASFAGGVLPTGVADFSPGELAQAVSFEFTATERPLVEQTGRLILRNPVTCRIDPAGERHSLTIPRREVSEPDEWDFTAVNMAVQPGPGEAGRVTFSAPGGVPQVAVAGAPNEDGRDIALWFKAQPFQNYEVIWEYEKNEDTPAADAGGRFAQVWGSLIGTLKPADVTTWTAAQWGGAGDSDYADYSQCWRISHDTESTSADNANEARLIEFTEGDRNAVTPTPGPNFPMSGTGTKWRMVLRRDGQVVTFSKSPGGEAIQWSHPDLSRLGKLGFRFGRGRGGILRHHPDGSAFMRDLGDVPPPPPGTWPELELLSNVPASRRTNITGPGTYTGGEGHHFVLPAGGAPITGPITIVGEASKAKPCVLRCDVEGSDPTRWREMRAPVHLRGTGATVANLVFNFGGYGSEGNKVFFYGQYGRVVRCEFSNRPINGYYDNGNVFDWIGGTDTMIDACDFNSRLGQWWANITDGDLGQRIDIAFCCFEDLHTHPQQLKRNDNGGTTTFWGWLAQGKSRSDTLENYNFKVYRNYFTRAHDHASELFEIKGSGFSFYENTIENTPELGQRFRHGQNCRSADNNYIGGANEITVRGGYHIIINNGCPVNLLGGNKEYDDPGGGLPTSAFCQVGGNRSRITVGGTTGATVTIPAHDNIIAPTTDSRVDRNAGPISTPNARDTNSTTRVTGADFGKTPIRLSRPSIGLRLPRRP